MKISICIITKNESEKLDRCLSKLPNKDCEIVVVDTGSIDDSKAIAKKYTDAVYDYVWCDDFSKARNYAAQMAKNDIIMMVDTDEYLEQFNIDSLFKVVKINADKVGRICRKNDFFCNNENFKSSEYVSRIYDRRKYEYSGRIHEQIIKKEGEGYETYIVPLTFIHDGYFENQIMREKKSERNLKLLFDELDKNPEDVYICYQIGKSYYYKKDYKKAIEYFSKTFDKEIDSRLEYVRDMILTYGYALINMGNNKEALMLENLYEEYSKSADFVFLLGLIYMKNAMFKEAIVSFTCATQLTDAMVEGVNSYLADYNIGVIYECLGDTDTAFSYYQKCGDYNKAIVGIERIKK